GAGDSCRSISSLAPHAPHRKTKGAHAVRVTLFHPSMDTKGVDCPKRKRPPQRDTNKAFRLPFRAIVPPGWGKSGLLSLGAGDEPTPVWGTVWWRSTLDYTG
ncbi:hypothetical protein, partial [Aneurinibacillus aneurinilyticus]|uniref:hypothetical protein n=1 Tax=Aneurinibacillus aneurinilyticus TaxID=1391 RepID=UPI0023F35D02